MNTSHRGWLPPRGRALVELFVASTIGRARLFVAIVPILAVLALPCVAAPASAAPLQPSSETTPGPQTAPAGQRVAEEVGQLPEEVTHTLRGSFRRLADSSTRAMPAIAAALVVLVVSWGAAVVVRRIVRRASRYLRDPTLRHLLLQVCYYAVWILGIILALDALGVNPESVITALGLTGVAIGFALREVLSNFVSGVLILGLRFFEIGNDIVVGDIEGTVEAVDLRATRIRASDGRLVFVPNSDMVTSRLTNDTASPLRRASVVVYLGYRDDLVRALSIVLEAVRSAPGIAPSPAPSIQLLELAPQYVKVEARVWADSRVTDRVETVSSARIAVVRALAKAGIELPVPVTTIPAPRGDATVR